MTGSEIIFQMLNGNTISRNTLSSSPNWKENLTSFESIPIKEVFLEMERQFAVEVDFKNIDGSRLFSGAFEHNSLEKALQSVTIPMGMTFKINSSNSVVVYGEKD